MGFVGLHTGLRALKDCILGCEGLWDCMLGILGCEGLWDCMLAWWNNLSCVRVQVERLLGTVDAAVYLLDYTKLKTEDEAAMFERLKEVGWRTCAGACVRVCVPACVRLCACV